MPEKNNQTKTIKPVLLLIIDGFGVAPVSEFNAIGAAKTPIIDSLIHDYPTAALAAVPGAAGANRNNLPGCEQGHYWLGGNNSFGRKQTRTESLAAILKRHGRKVVKIAETEKYALVTYFFNGASDEVFENETRIIIPGPVQPGQKASQDLVLEQVAARAEEAINQGIYDLAVVNFANPDNAAQAGGFAETVAAIESVDRQIGRLKEAVMAKNGHLVITSDHGRADNVRSESGKVPDTAGLPNRIPLIIVNAELFGRNIGWPDIASGDLSTIKPIGSILDVAPTILEIMDIPKPKTMVGASLIKK